MEWSTTLVEDSPDIDKTRELVDGFAPPDAPYLDLGEPSWFPSDADRRTYWTDHAAPIVVWAREHGFASPRAAIRYGWPRDGVSALWNWGD